MAVMSDEERRRAWAQVMRDFRKLGLTSVIGS